ncbi:hypothetical protein EI94DRAFT_1762481 [Lactarius quietus]|nr:hypothetical protein EI94DRAFT_1762481 [Lactarius quietus]
MKGVSPNSSNLFPILPSAIRGSRYPGAMLVRLSPTMFPSEAGLRLLSVPSYQSQGWTVSTHLEGKRYAHIKTLVGITIVTEAHIMEPGVSNQLNDWLAIICNEIPEKHINLLDTSHLFLEIDRDTGACHYYFVDHALRTVFWLHTLDIISIRPPCTLSNGHFHLLQENYWIHVELFPETASKYSAEALNEIYDILQVSSRRADTLTSGSPAFPHTDEECERFIEILERNKDASSPLITIYIATLWGTIASHNSFIHFDSKRVLILTIVSKILLFGLPDGYQACIEGLCVDQLIQSSRWRKHVSETIDDLKQVISLVLALLSTNIIMMHSPPFNALIKLSMILCVLDLTVTFILLQEQRRLSSRNAVISAVHLDDLIASYNFQLISVVHSSPQALFIWALLLCAVQHFWMAFAAAYVKI